MYKSNYSSKLLDDAVEQFASLPGIGRKSALRLALHLLRQPLENVERFSESFISLKSQIRYCPVCRMISDDGVCPYCSDSRRDRSIVCVVESLRDVISIENTGSYNGLYHILGGIIAPMDGVGPGDLAIAPLIEIKKNKDIQKLYDWN